MSSTVSAIGRSLLALMVTVLLGAGAFFGVRQIWRELVSTDPNLAIALIAAGATILASTIAVMLGRYFERKRDIEAHFRADKVKIYDEFLQEFFKLFDTTESAQTGAKGKAKADADKLVKFLRNWQRKLVIWGGPDVLRKYFEWFGHMKRAEVNAKTVFLMDEFFRALRSDIGLSSAGLERGAFANLILRNADLLLAEAKKNPAITLEELAKIEEQKLGGKT